MRRSRRNEQRGSEGKLEQNYGSYKLTIKERGGKTEEITAAEIGYKVVITNELQARLTSRQQGQLEQER